MLDKLRGCIGDGAAFFIGGKIRSQFSSDCILQQLVPGPSTRGADVGPGQKLVGHAVLKVVDNPG
jgi:hypothetical protein